MDIDSLSNYLESLSWPTFRSDWNHSMQCIPTYTVQAWTQMVNGWSYFVHEYQLELQIVVSMFIGFSTAGLLLSMPFRRQFTAVMVWYEKTMAQFMSFVLHSLYNRTQNPIFLKWEIKAARISHKHSFLTLWAMHASMLWLHTFVLFIFASTERWKYMVHNPNSYEFWALWFPWSVNVVPISGFGGCWGGTVLTFLRTHPHLSWRRRFQASSRELDWHLPRWLRPEIHKFLFPRIRRFHQDLLWDQLDGALDKYRRTRHLLARRQVDEGTQFGDNLSRLVLEYAFAYPVVHLATKTKVIRDLEKRLGMKLDADIISMVLGMGKNSKEQKRLFSVWFPLKRTRGRQLGKYGRTGCADLIVWDGRRPRDNRSADRVCYFCFKCREFHSFQDIPHCD